MAIFGRKRIKKVKKAKMREFVPPVAVKETQDMFETKAPFAAPRRLPAVSRRPPVVERKRVEETQEVPSTFAPLFVKLTRYKQILNTMNYLKMSINLIKNQLSILSELDRLRDENLKLLHSAVNRVNNRLMRLDSEFMRPSGFMEEMPELQMQDAESLESTIVDLKGQIEHLKSEVETIA